MGSSTLPDRPATPRPRSRPEDLHALKHAALASAARLQLLESLVCAAEPRHLDDLAEQVDLHPSTVRGHLDLLEEAGLVERRTDHRGHVGRPQVRYVATARARAETNGCLGSGLLSDVLTAYLHREADDPIATGTRAGRVWAAELVRSTVRPTSGRDALGRVAGLLEELGFRSEVRCAPSGCVLVQPRCPFAAAVEQHGQLVCSVHLGLVDGLLEAVGSPMVSAGLVGDLEERTCAVRLRRRSRSQL
jgi:predicted ArsR family transcriptional regulator